VNFHHGSKVGASKERNGGPIQYLGNHANSIFTKVWSLTLTEENSH